jgi:hypothetical protein
MVEKCHARIDRRLARAVQPDIKVNGRFLGLPLDLAGSFLHLFKTLAFNSGKY